MANKTKAIVRASWIGIAGNAVLAIAKISIGLFAGSLAVVGDGIDSSTDVLTYIITLYTAGLISRPPNYKYPYGYFKAETIATKVLSFIIFFAGAQLLISSLTGIIEGREHDIPAPVAIYVIIFSIAGKAILSWWHFRVGKRIESPMLLANAKNMMNDILISGSVLLGLFFTNYLNLPVLDLIVAIGVSLWIMKVAFDIFMETNRELMDGVKDPSVYEDIFRSVEEVDGASNPHRIRVRKMAEYYLIALDVEVKPDIRVSEAHKIAQQVEKSVKINIGNVYDVLVHIEPLGNVERGERTGVSEKSFNDELKKDGKKS